MYSVYILLRIYLKYSGIAYAILQENSCPLFHLDLRLNPLGHEGALGIMRALVRTEKITELNLAGCCFEDDSAILFGMVLSMNTSLRVVDVSNNWFSDDGGEVRLYPVFLLESCMLSIVPVDFNIARGK